MYVCMNKMYKKIWIDVLLFVSSASQMYQLPSEVDCNAYKCTAACIESIMFIRLQNRNA